jgi:hypothetical protein
MLLHFVLPCTVGVILLLSYLLLNCFIQDSSFLFMGRLLEGFGVGVISYTVCCPFLLLLNEVFSSLPECYIFVLNSHYQNSYILDVQPSSIIVYKIQNRCLNTEKV